MAGLRLGFRVIETLEETGSHRVDGGELYLATFGAAPSLPLHETKPCSLLFGGRFLENAREENPPSFEPFASILGSVKVTSSAAEFTFLPSSERLVFKPSLSENPRTLRLDYDPSTFRGTPTKESPLRELPLPDPPDAGKKYRHFELAVALLVDGNKTSDFPENAILDVPLQPLKTGFVVEWPDELEVPPGLTFLAKQGDVERQLRWDNGEVSDGQRRFVFSGIEGAAPVDLTAAFEQRVIPLWKAQTINDPATPPKWETLLEVELGRRFGSELGTFEIGTTMTSDTPKAAAIPSIV